MDPELLAEERPTDAMFVRELRRMAFVALLRAIRG